MTETQEQPLVKDPLLLDWIQNGEQWLKICKSGSTTPPTKVMSESGLSPKEASYYVRERIYKDLLAFRNPYLDGIPIEIEERFTSKPSLATWSLSDYERHKEILIPFLVVAPALRDFHNHRTRAVSESEARLMLDMFLLTDLDKDTIAYILERNPASVVKYVTPELRSIISIYSDPGTDVVALEGELDGRLVSNLTMSDFEKAKSTIRNIYIKEVKEMDLKINGQYTSYQYEGFQEDLENVEDEKEKEKSPIEERVEKIEGLIEFTKSNMVDLYQLMIKIYHRLTDLEQSTSLILDKLDPKEVSVDVDLMVSYQNKDIVLSMVLSEEVANWIKQESSIKDDDETEYIEVNVLLALIEEHMDAPVRAFLKALPALTLVFLDWQ